MEAILTADLQEIIVGDGEISTPLGMVRNPVELIELLQAHGVQKVRLIVFGSDYEAIGRLIFQIFRSGIEVISAEQSN
jgi:hypothetical protein